MYDRDIQRVDVFPGYEYAISEGLLHVSSHTWATVNFVTPRFNEGVPKKLSLGAYGLIEALCWTPAVKYVGLNFIDITIALGVVGDGSQLGPKCTGIVRRVGSAVEHVKPRDKALAFSCGSFRTRIIISERICFKIDEKYSLESAITIPKRTVLIHSACGAVGIASIHICQIIQATDSSFLPDLMHVTGGCGADVVPNSLARSLLRAAWECVTEYGKMIEQGARDILAHGTLDMVPFSSNRAFFGTDLMDIINGDSPTVDKLVSGIRRSMDSDSIAPIRPVTIYQAREMVDAFRYMHTGTHMGKILIQMPEEPETLPCIPCPPNVTFPSTKSYLLVGSLGRIGKTVSTWMVESGARELVSLSHSAGLSTEDKAFLQELKAQGSSVAIVTGSEINLSDVQQAVSACRKPLAGVIHLAVTIMNQTIAEMSYKQWAASIAPKVDGAWNLHYTLDGNPLDFFPNYAAANSLLEGIAHYRRNCGLPCSVIQLGPVANVGRLSYHEKIMQHFRDISIRFLSDKDLLEDPSTFVSTIGMSHTKPSSDPTFHATWMNEARFTFYYNLEVQGDYKSNDPLKDLADRIEANPAILDDPETERILIKDLGAHIRGLIATLADMDDEHTANLVTDSLIAIEVKSSVRRYRRVDIGLAEINKAGTVRGLAKVVMAHWKAKYQKGEEQQQLLQQDNEVDGAEVQS
ncbi:KR domain-containing protein [Aspergillus alliaceus]|uniref:KR domain-containing protein n=1 Tax=Petromyces alliaceus TaxID=209559 RepID=UPI0012A463C3|nr:KR domain-containing protein [Aspergillus alliaceus]KAB8232040.1 KR domain-containing protein [Aspergillus alliaceus]